MLTVEKIEVYRRFGGDLDGFVRSARRGGSVGMTDDDWRLIDELRQALGLIASCRASQTFRSATEQKLLTLAADEPTRQALRDLSRT